VSGGKALVLDSNLLVLLVVGGADAGYIRKHKRLDAFTEADFHLLLSVIDGFDRVIVTPNTLAETWSLATQIAEPARSRIAQNFKHLVQHSDEQHRRSIQIIERDEFMRLGLTDSVMLTLNQEENTLLTADLDLYLGGMRLGLDVRNFNHLREAAGTI